MIPQPMALTMIAMPYSPKPRNPIHASAPSSAKTAEMPAITTMMVGTGAGQLILFGEYLSQYITVTAIAASRSPDADPKPPLAVPSRNATTTSAAPYMTSFSFALSLFQNAWTVGMKFPP